MAGRETVMPEVSVVVITLGRPGLYRMVDAILEQETAFSFEVILVVNGAVDTGYFTDSRVRCFNEEPGRGFSYYRNRGVELSSGRVIVFIDDDEMPFDNNWLSLIAAPVLEGRTAATTGGALVPMGHGALADSISLLGFPGGGSLGWENVWPVDEEGYTWKLCTCNAAISREVFEEIGGFEESLVYGAEDVYLSEMLLERGSSTLFVGEAAVHHDPRGDLKGFVSWQVRRGRSVYDLRTLRRFRPGHVGGRMKRTWYIVRKSFPTRLFLPVLFILVLEHACQLYGYALALHDAWRRGGMRPGGKGAGACN